MSKYNFQVKATITCFVQRECNSDEEAEEIKEMLENDRWALNEIMGRMSINMEFKNKIVEYFKDHGVIVSRVEQEGTDRSIVCHVSKDDNIKIANMKDTMETVLNVAVLQSDSFGMNVVIVEDNDLEEDE
jgi:hypothetical protein